MQDSTQLMASLRQRGVTLWTDDGQLHFSAPRGALSATDLQALREHKGEVVELLEDAELARGVPVRGRSSTAPLALTALQARKWKYVTELRGGRSERTCVIGQRIIGVLGAKLLRDSLERALQRHDAFRIAFAVVDAVPRQVLQPARHCELEQVDLQDLPAADRPREAMRQCESLVAAGIDLCVGPLFAARLLTLSEREHVFIVVIDHMISDAVSCEILTEEIWAIYRARTRGVPESLPAPVLQFADYVEWQHRTYSAWIAKHSGYWSRRLAGVPASKLAIHDQREPPMSAMIALQLDAELTQQLRTLARQERSLLAMVMMTICLAAISRWLEQPDFVLAFISNCRDRPELQRLVGFLADFLHMRIQVFEGDSFVDLLERVTMEFRSAYEHQDYGRVPDLIPQCRPEVVFNWIPNTQAQQSSPGTPDDAGSLTMESFRIPVALPLPVPMKLAPAFEETATQIAGVLVYRPDVFTSQAIERLAVDLVALARHVARHPRESLSGAPQ